MADTTSINDLPVSPQADHGQSSHGQPQNNISFDTIEKNKVIADPSKQLAQQREMEDKKIAGSIRWFNRCSQKYFDSI